MNMVRIVGVLALLVVVVAILMIREQGQFQNIPEEVMKRDRPLGDFKGRVLAMEFVSDKSDIDKILGPDVAYNHGIMEKVLTIDFVWIGCYGSLFAAISLLLMRRRCPWARYLGFVALVAGLASAAFDVRENMKILAVMKSYDQHVVNQVNDAALLKWTLGFVAIALLGIAFQDLANRLANLISIGFTVVAVIGFIGLCRYPLLQFVGIPLLLTLILLAITAFLWPQKLKENTC
jgi:hypothetical protein